MREAQPASYQYINDYVFMGLTVEEKASGPQKSLWIQHLIGIVQNVLLKRHVLPMSILAPFDFC